MRIIIDLIGFKQGKSYGFQQYICNLLSYFSKNCHHINKTILIVCHSDEVPFLKSITGDNISYYPVKYDGWFSRMWVSHTIVKKLQLAKNDVVLYPGNTMPFFTGNCKKILVIHDLLFRHGNLCEKSLYFYLFRLHKYIYIPRSLKQANHIIAISEFTKKEIVSTYNVNPSKVSVIYNSFDFSKYYSDKPQNDIPDFPYVLSVCSSVKHKNHKFLLQSFMTMCENNKDFHLIIVGQLHKSAIKFYNNLDSEVKKRIHYMRNLSNADLRELYVNAKYYISSSLYEGLGMPVVEALYFGVPLILSDIEIHKEVSMNNAKFFNPSFDVNVLNDTLVSGYSHSNDIKGMLREKYSDENTSGAYLALLNRI